MGMVMHSERMAAMQYPESWMYKMMFVPLGPAIVSLKSQEL